MDIVINTTAINQFFDLPAEEMAWVFFVNFGWLILAIIFLIGVREIYLFWLRNKWGATNKNIMLAIDIPRGNEQSPKAVENLFSYLGGAHGSVNFFEKWFEGRFQKSFSFEIVSIEGYTQFLIYTPIEHRNLVETAVYSQYPDAEILEVDDYTKAVSPNLPDDEYDVWGTEFLQSVPSYLPIKCYQEFEHQIGPSETQFKDPMASLMDLCGSLRAGEQLWMQLIIIPTGFDWVKNSDKEADKILGRKGKAKNGVFIKILEAMGNASEHVFSIWGELGPAKEEKAKSMMELSPAEKKKIEAIQYKASKIGFEAKIRMVYIARREVMNKPKVVSGLVGYMKQFTTFDLNSFKPDVKKTFTKAVYFFTKSRMLEKQRGIFKAYIGRSDSRGCNPGLYNIEELATIWHFPIEANVKAAMIQKAPGRRADAPASLPLAEEKSAPLADIFQNLSKPASKLTSSKSELGMKDLTDKEARPPENLPFV